MSHWQSLAKVSPADREFSLIVRELHGWRCEKCGKLCRVNGEWVGKLECSHYIGRAKRSVRFEKVLSEEVESVTRTVTSPPSSPGFMNSGILAHGRCWTRNGP